MSFSYAEFTDRNLGFVTAEEQDKLRQATVFVCGTGGMGGAAVLALARAGVGRLILADIDTFEIGNLNRQVFAFTDTVGQHKAEATAALIRTINPQIETVVYRDDWPEHAVASITSSAVTINGTDDLAASLLLYRSARAAGRPVIDAYASSLPSVYVTRPGEPMPEERLGYPTMGTPWDQLTTAQRGDAFMREIEHVMVHSSARKYIDLSLAGEMAAGKRKRMSFAPMVITTGMLMAYETIALILGQQTKTDYRGWFFNPYEGKVERPLPFWLSAIVTPIARRQIARLVGTA
ncbi:MAG: ThiF family adenylyltransferase [Candidatus Devosia phytovorans]|uniref:ThiF family adenylyltransferase n=1 Tax=Candidatus Devosia phytovorans TaxID=3121372 RepID=A0AAJ6B2K3_9HYPH|nr:ThiF family adenylyltransferase [Devosia sp.]WEK06564.1 MAG: ThiF family adenylyltransferase [Devosia sp.]